MLGGNAVVSTVSRGASEKITEYINTEGEKVISDMVSKELEKYTSSSLSDITTKIGTSEINLVDIMMNIYEQFITNNLPPILKLIDISSIMISSVVVFSSICLVTSDSDALSLSRRTAKPYLLVRISATRLRSQMVSAPSSNWVVAH